jgi:hypothetical protein
MKRIFVVISLALGLLACNNIQTKTDKAQIDSASLRAGLTSEEIKTTAREAYIFCFPLNYYYRTIYSQIVDQSNPKNLGGFGKFRHDGLATPNDKETTMPNNDTPYSWGWVDLSSEPWVLIQPPGEGDRFYSSVWGDLFGHIIAYPGSVTTGQKGGKFLLVSSDWNGQLPPGIDGIIKGETKILGTLTRTAAFGQADMVNVDKIRKGYKLMPLSEFLKTASPANTPTPNWPKWNEASMTDIDFFKLTNFLMQFVVPNAMDSAIYRKMATLGVGPGLNYDPSIFNKEQQDALLAGIEEGHKEIVEGAAKAVNSIPFYGNRKYMGDRYLDLAVGVEVGGIIPNTPEQAYYDQWTKDGKGDVMDGSKNKYTYTFPKGQFPPVKFFWSLTMYDLKTRLLVANPINRYSIGDRTKGLKYEKDGSLILYVQHDTPGKSKESNWLPAPDGPMSIISRMYGPKEAILKGQYKFPDPVRVY